MRVIDCKGVGDRVNDIGLIVTPCRNEEGNLPSLLASLSGQEFMPQILWVIVNDGSIDRTGQVARGFAASWEIVVVDRQNDGGLSNGSAYSAWQRGVDEGLKRISGAPVWVMKLDADVILAPNYFQELLSEGIPRGVFGGLLADSRRREQSFHIPGPVKAYSWKCYESLSGLPRATGFDVMDEVAAREGGYDVTVRAKAKFSVSRDVGASEGRIEGRRRNGQVCRWVGYDPWYFGLHVVRYVARKPWGVGAVAMLFGYFRCRSGPYPSNLRAAHARYQREKLHALAKNPVKWLRAAYSISR